MSPDNFKNKVMQAKQKPAMMMYKIPLYFSFSI
jgi:hypothetical protein